MQHHAVHHYDGEPIHGLERLGMQNCGLEHRGLECYEGQRRGVQNCAVQNCAVRHPGVRHYDGRLPNGALPLRHAILQPTEIRIPYRWPLSQWTGSSRNARCPCSDGRRPCSNPPHGSNRQDERDEQRSDRPANRACSGSA